MKLKSFVLVTLLSVPFGNIFSFECIAFAEELLYKKTRIVLWNSGKHAIR